jgi:MFS family permease
MISSSYSLAACVTALFVGTFAFRIGRRGTVILGCMAAVVGSVVQSASYSVAQLIVGRVCTVSFPFLCGFSERLMPGAGVCDWVYFEVSVDGVFWEGADFG